jgi:hypothetical protein
MFADPNAVCIVSNSFYCETDTALLLLGRFLVKTIEPNVLSEVFLYFIKSLNANSTLSEN